MKNVNKVILLGNVTRDAEVKVIPGGKSVCTFGLATSRVWKGANGDWQSVPEYHNIVAWGTLADYCGKYVRKGKPLYIEGRLRTHGWEKPEGHKNFRTEVVLGTISFLAPKPDQEEAPAADDEAEAAPEEQEAVAAA